MEELPDKIGHMLRRISNNFLREAEQCHEGDRMRRDEQAINKEELELDGILSGTKGYQEDLRC